MTGRSSDDDAEKRRRQHEICRHRVQQIERKRPGRVSGVRLVGRGPLLSIMEGSICLEKLHGNWNNTVIEIMPSVVFHICLTFIRWEKRPQICADTEAYRGTARRSPCSCQANRESCFST
jgi:hypothetical protein